MKVITKEEKGDNYVCSVGHLKYMDNFLRKIVHQPKKMFGPYIKEGMTVMDLGCGGGFATITFARLAGRYGKVIAADLQDDMLAITKKRAEKAGLDRRIIFHKCSNDRIGYDGVADFVLAFFMIHETPDVPKLLKEVYGILKKGGLFYIAEPSFHVSRQQYETMIRDAQSAGFGIYRYPNVFLSRCVILKR
ncbi:MAG: class I SAM-dependent methyltransferase [Actinobacteria bacterium]|nr:class I SAM-dependent methyltransferase [Actinomycetota bacterium]